ncbi:microcompartment protein PduM [Vibrio sinensis]|uniref:Microcompartment protein PduM n=1 Tax=Vibrio sinensis TaxID=2302434 RepID=A0A3A6QV35_9VIBR|nr:PduM family microcompartment protein [Vibrio sinensis]RJX75188.1 microcompartment protein PduM [Vibrio sinensis]
MNQQTSTQIFVNGECANVQVKDLILGINHLMTQIEKPQLITVIRVILPDPFLLKALFSFDVSLPAIQTLFDAIAIGIKIELVVHRQLLPMLSVDSLVSLPVEITDHKGLPVEPITSSIIDYSDVALLEHCWLLTVDKPLVTYLAREHIQRHKISFITKKGGLANALGKNRWLRRRHTEN